MFAQAQGLVDAPVLTSTREFDQSAAWTNSSPFYFPSSTEKTANKIPPVMREAWLAFHTALMAEPEFEGFNLIASMGEAAKPFALALSERTFVRPINIGSCTLTTGRSG